MKFRELSPDTRKRLSRLLPMLRIVRETRTYVHTRTVMNESWHTANLFVIYTLVCLLAFSFVHVSETDHCVYHVDGIQHISNYSARVNYVSINYQIVCQMFRICRVREISKFPKQTEIETESRCLTRYRTGLRTIFPGVYNAGTQSGIQSTRQRFRVTPTI